jgi:hypothetical protein
MYDQVRGLATTSGSQQLRERAARFAAHISASATVF